MWSEELHCVLRSAMPQPLFTGISRAIVSVYYFREISTIQDIYQLPRRSHKPMYLMEILQDCCCLQMLLASIKEMKITPQAWIQVCSACDHPNAIPQSILIHALCL